MARGPDKRREAEGNTRRAGEINRQRGGDRANGILCAVKGKRGIRGDKEWSWDWLEHAVQ